MPIPKDLVSIYHILIILVHNYSNFSHVLPIFRNLKLFFYILGDFLWPSFHFLFLHIYKFLTNVLNFISNYIKFSHLGINISFLPPNEKVVKTAWKAIVSSDIK